MSRIRSIKPDFWTSEQVMECSPMARLAFIGMWNFCDDFGVHPASTKTLKAQVFPSDDISAYQISGLIAELIAQGLLREFQAQGKTWWHVTGWHHQKIDRPSKSKYPSPSETCDINPPPEGIDCSSSARRVLDEGSSKARDGREGKGREGSTEEKNTSTNVDVRPLVPSEPAPPAARVVLKSVKPPCPHEAIKDLYHEILPELPMCRMLTEPRKGYINQRWNSKPGPDIGKWRTYFEYVRESDFLMGRSAGSGGRPPFVATLEWLTRPSNFAKVIEGLYHKAARHG